VAPKEEVVNPKAKYEAAKSKPKPKAAPASGSGTKNQPPAPEATPANNNAAEESPNKQRRRLGPKGASVPATADTTASSEKSPCDRGLTFTLTSTAATRHTDEECRLTHPATCATAAVEIHPDDANTVIDQTGDRQTGAPVHPCEAETIPGPSLGCSFVCAAASDPTTQATYGIRNQLSYTTP
jgi:hypothetical protein